MSFKIQSGRAMVGTGEQVGGGGQVMVGKGLLQGSREWLGVR